MYLSEADRYPKRMGIIKNEVDYEVKLCRDRCYIPVICSVMLSNTQSE